MILKNKWLVVKLKDGEDKFKKCICLNSGEKKLKKFKDGKDKSKKVYVKLLKKVIEV